ncbi:MAG: hypothetical protein LBS81_04635 [Endomicrobium sp.]|jgi:hypothetical protein|nr:hypothetical protein [Endomicrobium sp.]
MVGGEFFIVAAAVGASSVNWKEYGIILILFSSRLDYSVPAVAAIL